MVCVNDNYNRVKENSISSTFFNKQPYAKPHFNSSANRTVSERPFSQTSGWLGIEPDYRHISPTIHNQRWHIPLYHCKLVLPTPPCDFPISVKPDLLSEALSAGAGRYKVHKWKVIHTLSPEQPISNINSCMHPKAPFNKGTVKSSSDYHKTYNLVNW